MIIELCGWLGAILFSFCAVPQVIKAFKTRKIEDLSSIFLLMWFMGEIFSLVYVLHSNYQQNVYQAPLIANYIFNLLLVACLIYAKIKY